ncbi:MAG: pseudaminic acid biosynthesis-associated methylase [Alphaproteobacteria bacterium]|nr:pseudaminic acid biosynthesis-associated methylase [Alphaproteobacteria bacterium]
MLKYKTEQENFWSGEFGDEYIHRNTLDIIPCRISMFSNILKSTRQINSILELGANIGINLHALHALLPKAKLHALEINDKAIDELRKHEWIEARQGSILEENFTQLADLSFTSGVLIHINPDALPKAYAALYNSSQRYVLVCEYYNSSPTTLSYRGKQERLFKRDFAGEMMDIYPDLKLIDYGFVYRKDPNFPLDDLTWFLMEKQ